MNLGGHVWLIPNQLRETVGPDFAGSDLHIDNFQLEIQLADQSMSRLLSCPVPIRRHMSPPEANGEKQMMPKILRTPHWRTHWRGPGLCPPCRIQSLNSKHLQHPEQPDPPHQPAPQDRMLDNSKQSREGVQSWLPGSWPFKIRTCGACRA